MQRIKSVHKGFYILQALLQFVQGVCMKQMQKKWIQKQNIAHSIIP